MVSTIYGFSTQLNAPLCSALKFKTAQTSSWLHGISEEADWLAIKNHVSRAEITTLLLTRNTKRFNISRYELAEDHIRPNGIANLLNHYEVLLVRGTANVCHVYVFGDYRCTFAYAGEDYQRLFIGKIIPMFSEAFPDRMACVFKFDENTILNAVRMGAKTYPEIATAMSDTIIVRARVLTFEHRIQNNMPIVPEVTMLKNYLTSD